MSRSGFGPRGIVLINKDGSINSNNNYVVNAYSNFAVNLSKPPTQTEKLDDNQIKNNAGGFVYQVSDLDRVKRFLVLGSEKGSYYANEQELTKDNCNTIIKLVKENKDNMAFTIINTIKEYSLEGRVPKQGPLIFALAICCKFGDVEVRRAGYDIVSDVCRIPTHLFMFITYCELLSGESTGWGRLHKRAINKWYNNKNIKRLAYLVTKYQNREGWTHKDVLRLSHIVPVDDIHNVLYHYLTKDREIMNIYMFMEEEELDALDFLRAVERVKKDDIKEEELVEYIRKYKLAREHIPNRWFSSEKVWEELLKDMPMTALIRNLGKMTNIGLLNDYNNLSIVMNKLSNEELIKKSRVHPLVLLNALNIYKLGRGDKGKLTWTVNGRVLDALDEGFYKSFKNVESTGKNWLLALDVSGSMGYNNIAGMSITPAMASAALALITASTEKNYRVMGFSSTFKELDITPRRRLDDIMRSMYGMAFGATDCSLPMMYAMEKKLDIDVFVVYTDNETYYGSIHPVAAIEKYRRVMNKPNAKVIVIGMVGNKFTIADPKDKGMMDVVGFDSSVPELMRNFVMED